MGCLDNDGNKGCCTFPHGQLGLYALLNAICTFIFVSAATVNCRFVEVDIIGFKVGRGLFSFERPDGTCETYDQDFVENQDSAFKTALAFGYLANVSVFVSIILLIILACMPFPSNGIKATGFVLVVAGICMCLTFVFFATELCDAADCKFGSSAGLAIAAIFLCFLTAMNVFKIPPAQEEVFTPNLPPPEQPGTMTKTETVMPDGTKKITTTTVNPDGSKTIEETVETS